MDRGKRVKFGAWDCELQKHEYQNGRVALRLVAWGDDVDDYGDHVYKGEPIATCTINVPEEDLAPNEVIVKDYSENEGMLFALVTQGVVNMTGRETYCGPICTL